ncbi:ATP-grasp domain-containing protein [Ornithinibacillus massiliensis]|uniref:Acylphosphatase n=1 Tax=Ornithinibacillus massiliensis TaxID=1944633 RepID=A0ABS5MAY3_9BACI|nr:ATP-grasp domain-containing protein [Ornithinibacillus massiliensis]MBS3679310.1 ATP-grasp domain-containing protein [Ornithinibacillus massiliensis]
MEGWRRGLSLKFINKNTAAAHTYYSLSNGKVEHSFTVARGDIVSNEAIKICIHKDLTKKYLEKKSIPIPRGKVFTNDNTDQDILQYASNDLGYPVVIKPVNGTGGHGVIANIRDEREFENALQYVKYELNYSDIIVEKYFLGEDYRLYVIGNRVVGAFKKIPANVIGDGKSSIRELLRIKNQERNSIPAFNNRLIKVDKETNSLLEEKGYTLDTVPKAGEQVFLKTKNNVSSGGDPIDVTDLLTDEIKQIAIEACNAIPGLVQCGVDMIVDPSFKNGVVLEINSRPHITSHLFPMQGKGRDIPKAIIDYYFPETKGKITEHASLLYFDFKSVVTAFRNGFAQEIRIPDLPTGEMNFTRYHLIAPKKESFRKWVQRQARKHNINGYVKLLKNGKTSVVVGGNINSINKLRELLDNHPQINSIEEKSWNKPVKVGFELIEIEDIDKKPEEKPYLIKYQKLEKDYILLKKKYQSVINSTSWKTTRLLRSIGRIFKR